MLDLGNIIGGASDEAGGAEFIDFRDAEAEDFSEKILAQIARKSGADSRGEETGRDGAD